MKNKFLLLSIAFALLATGCNKNKSNSVDSSNDSINVSESLSNSSSDSSSDSFSNSAKPPIILGGDFEEALKKDYKNMYAQFALNSMGFGQEYGYEYYLGGSDFVAVLDGTTAEVYGLDFAWSFYSYYNNKSYAYWDGSNYKAKGWISNGSKGIGVGIDYAYFYMPYFLQNITKDDVEFVMGAYVVKDTSLDKVMQGLKFTFMTNDISYVDIKISDEGYIQRIRGFDDPNSDEYGFQIVLSEFGSTKAPTSVELPPAISENNIKTYADMLGHEEEPDIYMTEMNVVINDTVSSDSTYDVIVYPDDAVDLSFSYKPTNANKREVNWHSTNEDVAEILYAPVSGHVYLRAISEGTTEIYLTHLNGDWQTVTSGSIKVKVNAPKPVPVSDKDVYRFQFVNSDNNAGNNVIHAINNLNTFAPYTITAWRMEVRNGNYSDNFTSADDVLFSAPNSSNNYTTRFEDEVIFDFENQQVSKISFAYALFRNNAKNSLNNFESFVISTSNDGNTWTDIDVTEEVRSEFNKASLSTGMSPKVMSKEFAPASMVKIVTTAKNVGGTEFSIGMKDFVFSKNDDCANFDDVEAVPVTSIAISSPRNKLKVNNSMKFTAVVNPDNASNKNVRWVSSDPTVISIDSRTGLATALKEGSATIYATSTTNKNMKSNELVITAYTQETLDDALLLGKTFFASNITSGVNKFDVTFQVKSNVLATLVLSIDIGVGQKFDSTVELTFDGFNSNKGVYEYLSRDNDEVTVKVSNDGSYIELTYKAHNSSTYTLGNETSGVRLEKAR